MFQSTLIWGLTGLSFGALVAIGCAGGDDEPSGQGEGQMVAAKKGSSSSGSSGGSSTSSSGTSGTGSSTSSSGTSGMSTSSSGTSGMSTSSSGTSGTGTSSSGGDLVCMPGAFVFCRCDDGTEGTKQCADDGRSFNDCVCQ